MTLPSGIADVACERRVPLSKPCPTMRHPTLIRSFATFAASTVALFAAVASQAQQAYPPFKVYSGKVGHFEFTRGVNTIKVNDGFLTAGTVPVSANGVYRIKAGQALALLYQGRNANGKVATDFGKLPVEGFRKVIRKVDGQEVQMENYPGASVRFELTAVNKSADDEYTISRKFKSQFSPPMPAADFERTDGIFLINSTDPFRALKEPAFAKDVNKVAGKVLTIYYLVSAIDATPFFTVEVDFTDVKPSTESKPAGKSAANDGSSSAAQLRDRADAQKQASDERAEAKKQRDEERAAAREAKAAARADAAAERARKRAEAAAARKSAP